MSVAETVGCVNSILDAFRNRILLMYSMGVQLLISTQYLVNRVVPNLHQAAITGKVQGS